MQASELQMRVYSTSDVLLESLAEFRREAGVEMGVELDESQHVRKSSDASSLITLLASLTWWKALGGAALAAYGTSIAKSAAEDTWRYKKEIASATTSKITKLASAIARLARRSKPNTKITIGFPFPNEYFPTQLEMKGADEDSHTVHLLLFIQYLPEIQALIEELKQNEPATGVFLRLLDNDSLEAFWFDGKNLQRISRIFRLPLSTGEN